MRIGVVYAARAALLAACSVTAVALASPAVAQQISLPAPTLTQDLLTNSAVTPGVGNPATGGNYANSPQVLSTGVNGVGQMFEVAYPNLVLCTGTLINPRTVITAAHCVDETAAINYGSNTGASGGVPAGHGLATTQGIPISFGFAATTRCTGTASNPGNGCLSGTGSYEQWRNSGWQTVASSYIYNGNQVWYGLGSAPASVGGGGEFANEDIALVTLDTHVSNVPTWTMLFSPLTDSTHTTIMGYGTSGVGDYPIGAANGIDYRRRSAENMIDALMSLHDFASSPAIFGGNQSPTLQYPLYWLDFDSPNYNQATGTNFTTNFDFNGLGGTALPLEGAVAPGDSGGPLIVDQRWSQQVLAGVVTGTYSFSGAGYYGEFDVYPPLFAYWQEIVQNNPYKYASAKAGNGDWFDPTHWVQDMDPNYVTIGANGQLVNVLPNTPQAGAADTADRFGTVCYNGQDCSTLNSSATPTSGAPLVIPGGPGSTNFVPNNVEPVNSADPTLFRRAQYYDVTLSQLGRTSLSASAVIDKLTVEGQANLNITPTGNLKVWAEYNQIGGWTNIDGALTSGESLMAQGLLSGSGTFDPTYLTVVGGIVAPGTMSPSGQSPVGTLTVKGDVILASASTLAIELMKTKGDLLNVVADADNPGILALNGGAIYFAQGGGAAVRDGQSFTVARAQGGVEGTFGNVLANLGVLQPTVTYTATDVDVSLKAGSLAAYVGSSNATVLAFASALDAVRAGSYNKLWNLYGNIDLMAPAQLASTLNSLAPSIVGETQLLQDRQSEQLFSNVSDRLSLLGTGQAHGMTLSGGAAVFARNTQSMSPQAQLGLTSSGQGMTMPIAGGLSGFITMGGDLSRASYGDESRVGVGRYNRYFASGVEAPFGNLMVGSAVGYAEATTNVGQDQAKSKLTQADVYASLPLTQSAYVGGVVTLERASSDSDRLATDTASMFRLSGAARSNRYAATAEAGFRTGIGGGLSLNPRAQLGFSHSDMGGFREQGGETALQLNELKVNRLESRLGAKLDGTAHVAGWTVKPEVQADYVRLLSGRRNGINVSFAAAPDYSFALPLANSGAGWVEAKGGVQVSRGAFSVGFSGQATVGSAPISDQRGLVDFTFKF